MSVAIRTGAADTYGELTASLFQAARAEVTIDRPAKDVWSVLTDLNYPTVKLWNPTVVSVQHISGEPRQEDEFVLVTKNTQQAPFYMRTIRIVPNQQRVLRIDAIDGSHCGFVDHSLYESNGKTTVVYNGYLETRRVPAEQVQACDSETAAQGLMDYLNHGHELLKKVVEAQSPKNQGSP